MVLVKHNHAIMGSMIVCRVDNIMLSCCYKLLSGCQLCITFAQICHLAPLVLPLVPNHLALFFVTNLWMLVLLPGVVTLVFVVLPEVVTLVFVVQYPV